MIQTKQVNFERSNDKYVPLNMLPADMVREYYSREEKEENENTI